EGTAFELTPNGSGYTERLLTDDVGLLPKGGLLLDRSGILYGTTYLGGSNGECGFHFNFRCGTLYALTPVGSGYAETTPWNFPGHDADGAEPTTNVIRIHGNLFGMTASGFPYPSGGKVYEVVPSKRHDTQERVLYTFCSQPNCSDGANPSGALLADS